jgi:hypothetical protein
MTLGDMRALAVVGHPVSEAVLRSFVRFAKAAIVPHVGEMQHQDGNRSVGPRRLELISATPFCCEWVGQFWTADSLAPPERQDAEASDCACRSPLVVPTA